jgi:hypothetical protein
MGCGDELKAEVFVISNSDILSIPPRPASLQFWSVLRVNLQEGDLGRFVFAESWPGPDYTVKIFAGLAGIPRINPDHPSAKDGFVCGDLYLTSLRICGSTGGWTGRFETLVLGELCSECFGFVCLSIGSSVFSLLQTAKPR